VSKRIIRSYSIIAGLIAGILLMSRIQSCQEKTHVLKSDTVLTKTVYDSIVRYIPTSSKFITIRDSVAYPIPLEVCVDTQLIVQQYFTAYYQQQTLRDSMLEATIEDTLLGNHIVWRNFSYKILRPERLIFTQYQPASKLQLYAGGQIGLGQNVALCPEAILVTKSGTMYSLGTNVLMAQPNILLGTYFKIGRP